MFFYSAFKLLTKTLFTLWWNLKAFKSVRGRYHVPLSALQTVYDCVLCVLWLQLRWLNLQYLYLPTLFTCLFCNWPFIHSHYNQCCTQKCHSSRVHTGKFSWPLATSHTVPVAWIMKSNLRHNCGQVTSAISALHWQEGHHVDTTSSAQLNAT